MPASVCLSTIFGLKIVGFSGQNKKIILQEKVGTQNTSNKIIFVHFFLVTKKLTLKVNEILLEIGFIEKMKTT